ncbi:hypothetical protein KU6B_44500 [Mameliella alba]|nr:hypothetical protein KU6B_44500 [Mameliella alba]
MRLGQGHGGMVERLFAQPVIIADHPVPGVADEAETEHPRDLLGGQRTVEIRKGRMFPDPPLRAFRQCLGPGPPPPRLGRVSDEDVVPMRARLQPQRHRGAAGLGDMDKDIPATGRQDHCVRLD